MYVIFAFIFIAFAPVKFKRILKEQFQIKISVVCAFLWYFLIEEQARKELKKEINAFRPLS